METIKKVITTEEITGYRAFDGQEFKEKEECEKYERSAIGVLKKQFMELIVKKIEMCNIECNGVFGFYGFDEDWCALIRIKNIEDVKIANMYWELLNPKATVRFTNDMIGKEIVVGLGDLGDSNWCYPFGSIEECTERYRKMLMELTKVEEKEEN